MTRTAPKTTERVLSPKYLRPRNVCELFNVSLTTVYTAIKNRELKARRFQSRIWLITPEDAANWLEEQSILNTDMAPDELSAIAADTDD